MVFSSLIFIFSFLPFLLVGNYLWSNRRWQNILLFIGSLFFYAWGEKEKVFVMLASIIVNYIVGLQIEKYDEKRKKKLYLTIGIIINLGVLAYFKYSEFFVENINLFLSLFNVSILNDLRYEKLPLGISFYTFQSISYLIDVYRNEVKVQRNFLSLGLYITLFPQLVAGPIVRYNEIEEQLINRLHSLPKFNEGVRRFLLGLGKKVLLADPISYIVDQVYALPADEINTPLAWLAMVGYTLQIYLDFSGYSDMAVGLGKMFGFNIPENFNYPYISKSIKEFWRRWHISLSIWFRDYLYIPLGGNRNGTIQTYRNLVIVFFVTGLWHGASWSFVIWGLSHGFFIVMEKLWLSRYLIRLPNIAQTLYTLFIVAFTFILFRLDDWDKATSVQKAIIGLSETNSNYTIDMFMNNYYYVVFAVGLMSCIPIFKWLNIDLKTNSVALKLSHLACLIIMVLCTMTLTNSTYSPFIYFKF